MPATFALPMFERSLQATKKRVSNSRPAPTNTKKVQWSLQEREEIEQGYEWEEMDVHLPQYVLLASVVPPVAPEVVFIIRDRDRTL